MLIPPGRFAEHAPATMYPGREKPCTPTSPGRNRRLPHFFLTKPAAFLMLATEGMLIPCLAAICLAVILPALASAIIADRFLSSMVARVRFFLGLLGTLADFTFAHLAF